MEDLQYELEFTKHKLSLCENEILNLTKSLIDAVAQTNFLKSHIESLKVTKDNADTI